MSLALRCEAGNGRLILLEEGNGLPDIVVQAFQPAKDIFYRTPAALTPEELAEETEIHVPQSLHRVPSGRLAHSTLGGLVLMQYVHPAFPAISPLAAIREILGYVSDVNYGILQADNGGLLFVHRAGTEVLAYASAHSLKEFLELPEDEREEFFPDFHPMEVLISGSDLDHFKDIDLGPISTARKIAIADFSSVSEIALGSAELIGLNPHLYTLAIGAARVYASIGGWL